MAKYRKKPAVIEAKQFTDEAKDQVYGWAQAIQMNVYASYEEDPANKSAKPVLKIPTLEGVMTASLGDWIIKGVKGELYPIKNNIFKETYEKVED